MGTASMFYSTASGTIDHLFDKRTRGYTKVEGLPGRGGFTGEEIVAGEEDLTGIRNGERLLLTEEETTVRD
ncbi:hypothetical protein L2E82_19826 [Cichorium intybus]|uniref:Uncharacterized protein n=1 Tax=Cichorium intybus TaxID=13427 RepID=A0ACB9DRA4_CICIN|nr:hypothetical protein L2E82_19826 [Cichorium intybus]